VNRSIRTTVLLLALAPTLLANVLISGLLTGERFQDAEITLEARGKREVGYLADAGEFAMLVGDTDSLNRLAQSQLRGRGSAAAVAFVDPQAQPIAAAGDVTEIHRALGCGALASVCEAVPGRRVFAMPVVAGANGAVDSVFSDPAEAINVTNLGHVVLSLSTSVIEAEQRRMFRDALIITSAVMLVAIFFALGFSRRLIGPIHNLSTVVGRIRSGDLEARVTPIGTGELRALERGVNEMADDVAASAAELNRLVDEKTAEVHRTNIDLERKNEELNAAYHREAEAGRAKDQFLARMSHELRTPLASVSACANVLVESRDEEELSNYRQTLGLAVDMLLKIINSVLELQRLDSDEWTLEEEDFDLPLAIRNMHRLMAPVATENGLSFECEIDPEMPQMVRGDRHRLAQVVNNLLGNAIKFTERGGIRLSVHLSAADGYCIEVSDTGIGIAPDQQIRLFEPFAQADESTRRRFGGSGLGLAIAHRLVMAMDGVIELSSAPGRGTTVRVMLPLVAAEVRAAMPKTVKSPARVALNVTVLLVEDNPMNRDLIVRDLLAMGAAVHAAEDGPSALATLARESVDLVLTDIHMPGMTGAELAARIRERWPNTPVYAVTASVINEDQAALDQAGVLGTLYKPWRRDLIAELLTAWSRPQSREALLREGIDADVRRVGSELDRLLASLVTVSDADQREVAHELRGVAQMFCSAQVVGLCARLESALDGGEWRKVQQYRSKLAMLAAFMVSDQ